MVTEIRNDGYVGLNIMNHNKVVKINFNIENLQKEIQPDTYTCNTDIYSRPDFGFVVARHVDGSIASRYGDDEWNYSAYKTSNRSSGIFSFKDIPENHKNDLKWILFCIERFSKSGRSDTISISTLRHYFFILKKVSKYANDNNISLVDWFSEPIHICFLIKESALSIPMLISGLLNRLRPISPQISIPVVISKEVKNLLEEKGKLARAAKKQTPIIPSRILNGFIIYASEVLEEFLSYRVSFELLLSSIPKHHLDGNSFKAITSYLEPSSVDYDNFDKFLMSKEIYSKSDLKVYIKHLSYCAKFQIHCYSGMRSNEALSLKYECLSEVPRKGKRVLRLIGDTTKYVGTRKNVKWITSKEVIPAIEFLQIICRVVYEDLLQKNVSNINYESIDQVPLFSSISTIFSKSDHYLHKLNTSDNNQTFLDKIPDSKTHLIRISEEDYKELELFDPLRDWKDDGFSIGNLWPVKSHQFRRSLAVYSAQSGLITLGSLKKQFKHLSADMSFYYRNNALEAKKIFDVSDKDHMAAEFEKNKAEADFLAYVLGVVMSDEELKGSQGKHHEKHKPKNHQQLIKVYEDKGETIKQFKKGERAFRETPVGFCEGTGACDKKLTGAITTCFTCEGATLKLSKIQQTKKLQENFLSSLDPESPEYRAELEELNRMKAMEESWV